MVPGFAFAMAQSGVPCCLEGQGWLELMMRCWGGCGMLLICETFFCQSKYFVRFCLCHLVKWSNVHPSVAPALPPTIIEKGSLHDAMGGRVPNVIGA